MRRMKTGTGRAYKFITDVLLGLFSIGAQADNAILVGYDKVVLPPTTDKVGPSVRERRFSGLDIFSQKSAMGNDWCSTTPSEGSADGTFGSLVVEATTGLADNDGGFWTVNMNGLGYIDIQVKNGGRKPYNLTLFYSDAWRKYAKGSDGYVLSIVDGDLTLTNQFATGTFTQHGMSNNRDFDHFDIPLAGLPDKVLWAGKSVTFRLQITDCMLATIGGLFVDNIVVFGSLSQ